MSRFLSKLSPIIHKSRSVRLFSSSTTGPYLSLSVSAKPSPEGVNIGEVVLFDAAKQELLELPDRTIPEEIVSAKGMGASKGWEFFCDPHDRCVLITDFLNPWACKSNLKLFTLPPLTPLLSCQTDVVWNVAMSSCPDEDENWVVGIESLGDLEATTCYPLISSSTKKTSLSSMSCSFATFQSRSSITRSCLSCFLLRVERNALWSHPPEMNVSSSNGTPRDVWLQTKSPMKRSGSWCLERRRL